MSDTVADALAENFPGVTTFMVMPVADWNMLANHLRDVYLDEIPDAIRDMHIQLIELETAS